MIDEPQIVDTPIQHAAVIHLTIPREEIRNVMGPGLAELMATVAAQGLKPSGSWFTHHFRMAPTTFDFEIGVPVDQPVVAAGRVKPGQLPAGRVARTVYQGGYEGLGGAWGKLGDWISAGGHTPGENLWEVYKSGPEANPDPTSWRTELNRPLL